VDLSVFFAGTGGSLPTPRRGLPATLIRRGSDRILVDCGEGTQRQLIRSVGLLELTEIYLTHFHADHWLGLPGLLKTFDLRGRETPLAIHGPRGVRDLIEGMLRYAGRVGFDLRLIELEPGEELERDGYAIEAVQVSHRGTAYAYALREPERPGVFDPAAAIALGLTPGPEFGLVQKGATVRGVTPAQVMGPSRPGRTIVISGDTRPCEAVREAAEGADLLIHEATFAIEDAERAHETGHSTATQAAGIARDAGVRLLALVHTSTRYPARLLRDEAREIFPAAVLPRDFDTIEVPLAEKGDPELLHWSDLQERSDPAPEPHQDPAPEPDQDAAPEPDRITQ
jgi:ribonuclease Z